MKVCFVAGTLGRGGAERQLVYMLQALRAVQIQTRVLCLTKGEAFEDEIRDLGVEIEWVGDSKNQFVRLGKIIRNLRRRPADILQSAHFYTNIYTALAGRVLGTPSIGAIRSDMLVETVSNGFVSRWHLGFPKEIIANSQIAVDRAIAKGIDPDRIHLVRNVVGKQGDNSDSKNGKVVRILFAGRLVKAKRCDLFIEMARKLLNKLPDTELEFIVAGDGPLRPDLEAAAFENDLDGKKLKFLGEQDNMSTVYRECDILVLTSDHEGTPNVVLEAMAHGMPVVATKVGGVPDVINDHCGILVEPANLEELVNAATKLIRNSDLRRKLGEHGVEHVGKHHSIGYLQDRLTHIYSNLLETR